MVQVRSLMIGCAAALPTERTIRIDNIDHRKASPQLRESDFSGATLESTTKYLAVERDKTIKVIGSQNQVIDDMNVDRIGFLHVTGSS